MSNEFASLATQTPKSDPKPTMPMQNTIQKQVPPRRDRAKRSRLERAVIMKLASVLLPAIAVTAIALSAMLAPAAEPKVKIGVSLALFDDVFISNVREAMTKWAKDHPDADLTFVDANNDTAKQVGEVENFLVQGKDAIVILPVDTTATGPMTKAVIKAGKPLVYVNRKPSNLPNGVVYVGSKSIEAGIMNMEELGKAMGGKGNLGILIGELSKIPVGGTDGTHDALVSMEKGELNNTVYQDPVAQGEEAVNAAYLIAKHEPNPKVEDGNIWIPYQKITKENYKSFMK
jgi:ABC-type sugar transport system substrate-binding protein